LTSPVRHVRSVLKERRQKQRRAERRVASFVTVAKWAIRLKENSKKKPAELLTDVHGRKKEFSESQGGGKTP